MLVTSFAPIIGEEPSVLLLGSMPGGESLRRGQYYAHPRNLFWPFLGEICGAGPQLAYPARAVRLTEAGVALWDVLKHCEREGSLDSNIRIETEAPNAIADLLETQPTIRAVAFNGQKAAAAFRRLTAPALSYAVARRLEFHTLPSTSPANTAIFFDAKLAIWLAALSPYLRSRPGSDAANFDSRPQE